MIEHLLNGLAQSALRRWVLFFALLIGAGSFAAQDGRALLMDMKTPNAFAAVAQSAPNSITGLDIANQPGAAPQRRRPGPDGVRDPDGYRPASFGVGPRDPLLIDRGNSPVYRPDVPAGSPVVSRQALNFTPPDDVLPAAGGGVGNAAVTPTPPVPEPSSILLTAFGMAMLGALAWRRGRRIAA